MAARKEKMSHIRIYKHAPFDDGLENVMRFDSQAQMDEFFENPGVGDMIKIIFKAENASQIKNTNSLIVPGRIDEFIGANYMKFRNYDITYYAFVNTVQYIEEDSTMITFTIDPWNTLQPQFYNWPDAREEDNNKDAVIKGEIGSIMKARYRVVTEGGASYKAPHLEYLENGFRISAFKEHYLPDAGFDGAEGEFAKFNNCSFVVIITKPDASWGKDGAATPDTRTVYTDSIASHKTYIIPYNTFSGYTIPFDIEGETNPGDWYSYPVSDFLSAVTQDKQFTNETLNVYTTNHPGVPIEYGHDYVRFLKPAEQGAAEIKFLNARNRGPEAVDGKVATLIPNDHNYLFAYVGGRVFNTIHDIHLTFNNHVPFTNNRILSWLYGRMLDMGCDEGQTCSSEFVNLVLRYDTGAELAFKPEYLKADNSVLTIRTFGSCDMSAAIGATILGYNEAEAVVPSPNIPTPTANILVDRHPRDLLILTDATTTFMQSQKNQLQQAQNALNLESKQIAQANNLRSKQTDLSNEQNTYNAATTKMNADWARTGNAVKGGASVVNGVASMLTGNVVGGALQAATGGASALWADKGYARSQEAAGKNQDWTSQANSFATQQTSLENYNAKMANDIAQGNIKAQMDDLGNIPQSVQAIGSSISFERGSFGRETLNLLITEPNSIQAKLANQYFRKFGVTVKEYDTNFKNYNVRKFFNYIKYSKAECLNFNCYGQLSDSLESALQTGVRIWNYSQIRTNVPKYWGSYDYENVELVTPA
jgi:hypothetical protein